MFAPLSIPPWHADPQGQSKVYIHPAHRTRAAQGEGVGNVRLFDREAEQGTWFPLEGAGDLPWPYPENLQLMKHPTKVCDIIPIPNTVFGCIPPSS